MTLLDRYIFSEAAQLLLIGSLLILGIFFGTVEFNHIMDMIRSYGLPVTTVLWVMILQLPTGVAYCLPAGVLISVLFCMTRQQKDCEILALQVSGVSIRRIMAPYLVMGLVGSLCGYLTTEYVAPQTRNLSAKMLLVSIFKTDKPFIGKSSFDMTTDDGKLLRRLVFGNTESTTIKGFVMFDVTEKDVIKLTYAKQAHWGKAHWTLTSGQQYDLLTDSHGLRGSFQSLKLEGNEDLVKKIDEAPTSMLNKTTKELVAEIENYKKKNERVPDELMLQYYRRYSIAFNCFLLVLAALPLAVTARRGTSNGAALYGGILVTLYFIGQQISVSLAENNRIDPLLGAWLPGGILALVGLTLTFFLRRAR